MHGLSVMHDFDQLSKQAGSKWIHLLCFRLGLWLMGFKTRSLYQPTCRIDINAPELKPQVIATPKGLLKITPGLAGC